MNGIRYPGDDGSEPEDVRERKAQDYADEVLAKAKKDVAAELLSSEFKRIQRGQIITTIIVGLAIASVICLVIFG